MPNQQLKKIILASSSIYRRSLIEKIVSHVVCQKPNCDEDSLKKKNAKEESEQSNDKTSIPKASKKELLLYDSNHELKYRVKVKDGWEEKREKWIKRGKKRWIKFKHNVLKFSWKKRLSVYEVPSRHYSTTEIQTLAKAHVLPSIDNNHKELLTKLYNEICSSWRQLTEVRFKLLGLVPVVSATILISLFSREERGKGLTEAAKTIVAVFGLIVTLSIYIYEKRNSELYDDLISRGRKIEKELGIETGQFLGRLEPSRKTFLFFKVQHGTAISGIYSACLFAWIIALIYLWRCTLAGWQPLSFLCN